MDQDGANHRFLTNGQSIVLTPRMSPKQNAIVYMSYTQRKPAIYVYDMGTRENRLLVSNVSLSFAPRFPRPTDAMYSSRWQQAGNTDIYRIASAGGEPQRLTNSPGIDTGGSYSPDGSKIVFESDRSGTQQIYVMNADGFEPAPDQLRRRALCHAGMEPARRSDRLHGTGGGAFRIGDEPERRRREAADQQLGRRGAELVAQRPRADVLPLGSGFGPAGPVVGGPHRHQCAAHSDAARRIGSQLGTDLVPWKRHVIRAKALASGPGAMRERRKDHVQDHDRPGARHPR